MTTTQAAPAATPKFDNHGQYSRTGILRYEMIFGEGYISTGGVATTEDLCNRLGSSLKPGVRVLDVGSGIGGAAFHLADVYGAKVIGIDLAEEMVNIALERAAQRGMSDSVKTLLGDVLETSFPEPFDIIWSRDAFMHIPDKPKLFSRLYQLLAPDGKLVITDYAARRLGHPSLRVISKRPVITSSSRATTAGCSKGPGSRMSSSTMPRRVSLRSSGARPIG
jgi:phosphoethanolamine N-methyltransferase